MDFLHNPTNKKELFAFLTAKWAQGFIVAERAVLSEISDFNIAEGLISLLASYYTYVLYSYKYCDVCAYLCTMYNSVYIDSLSFLSAWYLFTIISETTSKVS